MQWMVCETQLQSAMCLCLHEVSAKFRVAPMKKLKQGGGGESSENRLREAKTLHKAVCILFWHLSGTPLPDFYKSTFKICGWIKNIYKTELGNCNLDREPRIHTWKWEKIQEIKYFSTMGELYLNGPYTAKFRPIFKEVFYWGGSYKSEQIFDYSETTRSFKKCPALNLSNKWLHCLTSQCKDHRV